MHIDGSTTIHRMVQDGKMNHFSYDEQHFNLNLD